MRTADLLKLAAMIGRLEFRALNDSERLAFEGAAEDALICDATGDVDEVAALLGASVSKYGYIAVLGDCRLELHGVSHNGAPVSAVVGFHIDPEAI
jgi:hypothetical protein